MEKINEENQIESQIDRSPEVIRELFKQKYLIIDDGYDYVSESVPEDLPTLFHGTSEWFKEDIEKEGLTNKLDSVQNIKEVFDIHPDLATRFSDLIRKGEYLKPRMKPDEHALRRKIYCTYNHDDANIYGKGPEILREYIKIMKRMNQDFYEDTFENIIPKIIEDLQPIDTFEKKLLMSCLEPKVLIAFIKATKQESDAESTIDYGQERPEAGFLSNTESRKELLKKVMWARDRHAEHAKGNLVSMAESGQMWDYIQDVLNIGHITAKELEGMSLSDLVQIHLRSKSGYIMSSLGIEVLFKKIDPESIVKLEETFSQVAA